MYTTNQKNRRKCRARLTREAVCSVLRICGLGQIGLRSNSKRTGLSNIIQRRTVTWILRRSSLTRFSNFDRYKATSSSTLSPKLISSLETFEGERSSLTVLLSRPNQSFKDCHQRKSVNSFRPISFYRRTHVSFAPMLWLSNLISTKMRDLARLWMTKGIRIEGRML